MAKEDKKVELTEEEKLAKMKAEANSHFVAGLNMLIAGFLVRKGESKDLLDILKQTGDLYEKSFNQKDATKQTTKK